MKKNEVRTIECKLCVREAAQDASGGKPIIGGTAIVFNSLSEVLDDWGERFREIILPDACTADFLGSQDVKLNLLHEREMTIARCNKGVGSLRLMVDEEGVNFELEANTESPIVAHAVAMIADGTYSGCSFEFEPMDYDIGETPEGEVLITHKKFKRVTAITIGMDPAYSATNVNVRECKGNADGREGGNDGEKDCKGGEGSCDEPEMCRGCKKKAECQKGDAEQAECQKKSEEAKDAEERERVIKYIQMDIDC